MKRLLLAIVLSACTTSIAATNGPDPVASVRKMSAVLEKSEFAAFHADWCHPHVLIAQPEADEDGTVYEFILVQVRKKHTDTRGPGQWHLEIQLHNGEWKLMDTD